MDDITDMIQALTDQARVHERNGGCVGLPYCASCRAAVLLHEKMNIAVAEAWINTQEPGTVVLLKQGA